MENLTPVVWQMRDGWLPKIEDGEPDASGLADEGWLPKIEDGEPDASGLADELWLPKIEDGEPDASGLADEGDLTPVVWQMSYGCLR